MLKDVQNVSQLLVSDHSENTALAMQIIKGNKELKERVEVYFHPILEASNKKRITALPTILEQLKIGKGTLKARFQIGTVPELYGYIEKLSLNDQKMEVLPEWIQHLSNLKTLALSNCQLKVLPNWIGNLNQLTFLSVAGNQLTTLPDSFVKLTKLEVCYVIENNLETLPDSLERLISLKRFHVKKRNTISRTEMNRIRESLPNAAVY